LFYKNIIEYPDMSKKKKLYEGKAKILYYDYFS
jgi:hypothetical protein